jgi:hypothetical protein
MFIEAPALTNAQTARKAEKGTGLHYCQPDMPNQNSETQNTTTSNTHNMILSSHAAANSNIRPIVGSFARSAIAKSGI